MRRLPGPFEAVEIDGLSPERDAADEAPTRITRRRHLLQACRERTTTPPVAASSKRGEGDDARAGGRLCARLGRRVEPARSRRSAVALRRRGRLYKPTGAADRRHAD